MAVPAPADRRFKRAQVSPARRRRLAGPWPRLAYAALAVVALAYAAYHGGQRILASEALTITRITVSGNTALSRGEVLSLLEDLRGRNMVLVRLEEWRRKLLASPWIADVALRRVLPGTVDVRIAERQPVGIARIGSRLYLVDRTGSVIDEFGPNYAGFDLPLIDGLAARPSERGGTLIDPVRAALAGRLLASLREHPELAARISQIDVSSPRDAVVMLKGDTALVRLGDAQFAARLQSYLDLAPALRERVAQIDYVDLRFGERVYVRPRAAGPAVRRTPAPGPGQQ